MVFGQVSEGLDVVRAIEAVGTASGSTQEKVTIIDCGQLAASSKQEADSGSESSSDSGAQKKHSKKAKKRAKKAKKKAKKQAKKAKKRAKRGEESDSDGEGAPDKNDPEPPTAATIEAAPVATAGAAAAELKKPKVEVVGGVRRKGRGNFRYATTGEQRAGRRGADEFRDGGRGRRSEKQAEEVDMSWAGRYYHKDRGSAAGGASREVAQDSDRNDRRVRERSNDGESERKRRRRSRSSGASSSSS